MLVSGHRYQRIKRPARAGAGTAQRSSAAQTRPVVVSFGGADTREYDPQAKQAGSKRTVTAAPRRQPRPQSAPLRPSGFAGMRFGLQASRRAHSAAGSESDMSLNRRLAPEVKAALFFKAVQTTTLRAGPFPSSAKVGILSEGEHVRVSEALPANKNRVHVVGRGWCSRRAGDGTLLLRELKPPRSRKERAPTQQQRVWRVPRPRPSSAPVARSSTGLSSAMYEKAPKSASDLVKAGAAAFPARPRRQREIPHASGGGSTSDAVDAAVESVAQLAPPVLQVSAMDVSTVSTIYRSVSQGDLYVLDESYEGNVAAHSQGDDGDKFTVAAVGDITDIAVQPEQVQRWRSDMRALIM